MTQRAYITTVQPAQLERGWRWIADERDAALIAPDGMRYDASSPVTLDWMCEILNDYDALLVSGSAQIAPRKRAATLDSVPMGHPSDAYVNAMHEVAS